MVLRVYHLLFVTALMVITYDTTGLILRGQDLKKQLPIICSVRRDS